MPKLITLSKYNEFIGYKVCLTWGYVPKDQKTTKPVSEEMQHVQETAVVGYSGNAQLYIAGQEQGSLRTKLKEMFPPLFSSP